MRLDLIAVGAVVGAAVWAVTSDEDTSILDPVTDILETYDMTNAEALNNANVRAFLGLIRKGEGTADAGGYARIVGGGSFSGWEDHPRRLVKIDRLGISSTAAGAYQILSRTWDMVRLQAGLRDFSPASQDLAAVQLIRNRGALADVLAGRIEAALRKCSYEWASLPPWRYGGQGTMNMERALGLFENYGGALYA
ncbi:MAG: glycoside hydrolase family 104 protein [Zoogloea sp.]|nr:glycoside hydrolase family 104 protein [Zoogloea sp.]